MKLKFEIEKDFVRNVKLFEMWSVARIEIQKKGFHDFQYNENPPYNRGDALSARTINNKLVGLLTFYENNSESLWISTSYVLPKYRKLGVYRQMRIQLTEYAKEKDYKAIFGGVDIKNTDSIKAKLSYGDKIILQTFKEVIW